MKDDKFSSKGLDLFSMLVAGLLHQATDILNDLDNYSDNTQSSVDNSLDEQEKKEYVAPTATVEPVDRSTEKELKYPKFEYTLYDEPEDGEKEYSHPNDNSPIDDRMKKALDSLIFKIRMNYAGEVEYDVQLTLGEVVGKFNWNIEHDRFEGTISKHAVTEDGESNKVWDNLMYVETEKKFYDKNTDGCDACDCCDEEPLDVIEDEVKETVNECKPATPTKESVKFDDARKDCGTHIKIEEISQKENMAEYLYRRLNADKQNKIKEALDEVEISVARIIDYKLYDIHSNEKDEVNAISFEYSLIEDNFRNRVEDFNSVNPSTVIEFIKTKFGFADVYLDVDDVVTCVLKAD